MRKLRQKRQSLVLVEKAEVKIKWTVSVVGFYTMKQYKIANNTLV